MSNGRLKLPAPRLIAFAALAGVVAGGLVVYVKGGADGNNAALSAAEDACADKAGRAETVGAAATGEVAAMLAADPPRSLSDLAFDGPDGEAMTLADMSGRAVLLNLWATWCAPCREEMPALDELQAGTGGEDFEVVAVNVDSGDDAKPRAFLEEVGVEALAYYRDDSLDVFNELKRRGLARGLPVTLLIDEEGCLLASMNGPADWADEDARALVARASGREG